MAPMLHSILVPLVLSASSTVAFAGRRLMTLQRAYPEHLIDPIISKELASEAVAWASANGFQMANPKALMDGRRDGGDDDGDDDEGGPPASFTHVPFSLLPNAVPKAEFERAVRLAPLLNLLMDSVACDQAWLLKTLEPVLAGDPFTARLASLMASSPKQPVRLGIHRSDYMVDGPSKTLLQVELNTIASSFGCVSSRASLLHKHLLARFLDHGDERTKPQLSAALEVLGKTYSAAAAAAAADTMTTEPAELLSKGPNFNELAVTSSSAPPSSSASLLPENPALERLSGALAAAHSTYVARKQRQSGGAHSGEVVDKVSPPVVLFVVQAGERNVVDQRLLEFALWERHGVKVRRATLAEVNELGRVDHTSSSPSSSPSKGSPQGKLLLRHLGGGGGGGGEDEVSVCYFRAGYTPDDFPGEAEWRARELLECAAECVKCPTLAYHLAGTKKVQQQLAQPGEVEAFLSHAHSSLRGAATWQLTGFTDFGAADHSPESDVANAAREIRTCFAGLHPVVVAGDNEEEAAAAAHARALALENPEQFVLKPQREGGGNNFYGAELAEKLQHGSDQELSDLILMQRIMPPLQPAVLVTSGRCRRGNTLSELGVFSTFLAVDNADDDADAEKGGDENAPSSSTVLVNEYAGHILRTKLEGVDEGGVATGFAVLSSPLLVE